MSHYISADLNGELIEFTYGLSWRSISALNESGWGIYENYEGYSWRNDIEDEAENYEEWPNGYNMGVSGSGNESIINYEIAANAYKNALLWARAFKESHPELYKEQYKKADEILKDTNDDLEVYLNGLKLSEEYIHENLEDLIKYQKMLTPDKVERAFTQFRRVLEFSYKIFKFTSEGKIARVYFS